jgi:hypothetical protein
MYRLLGAVASIDIDQRMLWSGTPENEHRFRGFRLGAGYIGQRSSRVLAMNPGQYPGGRGSYQVGIPVLNYA